jgi:superfamily I DNA/RNA helicase
VNEDRVVGPPGTGKTTFLTKVLQHHAHDKVVVAISHTKAAAVELAGRETNVPSDNISTLHALGYRSMGSPALAEKSAPKAEFSERYPQWQFETEDAAFDTGGADMLSEYSRLRNICRPRDFWPMDVTAFAQAWETFKKEEDLIDFVDMIEYAADVAPQNPQVMIVDEAQDMSRLQWQLVQKWASHCEKIITAGDADQTIFGWAGADIAWFKEHTPARKQILSQSYRVPRAVHKLAMGWIRQCRDREDVEYQPRDYDGSVTRSPATIKYPIPLMHVIDEKLSQGKSVMIMASCAYMLNATIKMLREHNIPYANKWRRKEKRWNPLRGKTFDAVHTFSKMHTEKRFWLAEEIHQWMSIVGHVLPRGGKQKLEWGVRDDVSPAECLDRLGDLLSYEDLTSCIAAPPDSLDWLESHLLAAKKRPAEFPLQLLRNGKDLADEPQVSIGTCHSFKGGEADCVIIFPDLSQQGMNEWVGRGRDSVLRLFYVGLTRAREDVILATGATGATVW